jgi:hypothetical protein
VLPVAHVQSHLDVGVRLLEGAQEVRQDIDADRRIAAQSENATPQAMHIIDGEASRLEIRQDAPHVLIEQPTGSGQMNAPGDLLKKGQPDGVRERFDLM